jgi:hypothetical protein
MNERKNHYSALLRGLDWKPDRMLFGDLVFRLEHYKQDEWDGGEDFFWFYKNEYLLNQYAQLFTQYDTFFAENVVELGMWDGGSLAFWTEVLNPKKIVGIDLADKDESSYFRKLSTLVNSILF